MTNFIRSIAYTVGVLVFSAALSVVDVPIAHASKKIVEHMTLTFLDGGRPMTRPIQVNGTEKDQSRTVHLKLPNGEPFTSADGYCVLLGYRSVHHSFSAFATVNKNKQWILVAVGGAERPVAAFGYFTCIRFEK